MSTKKKSSYPTICLSNNNTDMWDWLRGIARGQKRSLSNLVHCILEGYLKERIGDEKKEWP